ncbi:hypothetical protein CY34DRAFT_810685 [Suillus luteus UH-Slu-Lm8-n1]|uniref:Uncharacterized protein n=1 Tax=Suillus luteus UH-Slu-Lm8-n1 TaxID=930992 RepID=A0A0C9ZI88_9AGAM|nr:hypothetical protein CY34DRAFT_810685 [Suillus luteus UH-Slu-Lm8-n1]
MSVIVISVSHPHVFHYSDMARNLPEPHSKDNGRPLQDKLVLSFNAPRLILIWLSGEARESHGRGLCHAVLCTAAQCYKLGAALLLYSHLPSIL